MNEISLNFRRIFVDLRVLLELGNQPQTNLI